MKRYINQYGYYYYCCPSHIDKVKNMGTLLGLLGWEDAKAEKIRAKYDITRLRYCGKAPMCVCGFRLFCSLLALR